MVCFERLVNLATAVLLAALTLISCGRDHCQKTKGCLLEGKCSAGPEGGCIAGSSADCRESRDCRLAGQCTAEDGRCTAQLDGDWNASSGYR